jgi:ribose transport system permease protein
MMSRSAVRWERWLGPAWLWGLLVLLFLIGFIASPYFLTTANFSNILQQAAPLGVVATGQTFALLVAGIDISVAATISMGLTAMMAIVDGDPANIPRGIAVVLGAALLIGLVNGAAVVVANVPAFIVTFGVASIVQGVVFMYTDQVNVGAPAPEMTEWGYRSYGPIPLVAIVMLVFAVLALVIQNRTLFGRWLFAVGGNDEVARLAGVPVRRVRIGAYMFCAFSAGLAALLVSLRTGAGDPLGGTGFDWDSVAAVVIGGTALAGGRGGVAGSVLGAVLLVTLSNIMNLLAVSGFWQIVLKGGVVLLAVLISALGTRRAERLAATRRPVAAPKRRLSLVRS